MVRSKLNCPSRGAFFLLFFLTLFTLLLPVINYIFPSDSVRVLRLLPLSEAIFILFTAVGILSWWLYLDVFRKAAYIFGDEHSLHLKLFLRRKIEIPWEQIGLIDFVQPECWWHPVRFEQAKVGRGTHIQIIVRETSLQEKPKRRFSKTYYIPLSAFVSLDRYG